jgi:hypothetical protein
LRFLHPTFAEHLFSGRMDALLLFFMVAVAALGFVVAIGAALRSSVRSNWMLADSSLRSRERVELGLGGSGRSVRSVTPKYR